MLRAAALAGVLAGAAAWADCAPGGFIPHAQRGATKRGLILQLNGAERVLEERGKVVWKIPGRGGAQFSPDDGWVVFTHERGAETLTLLATQKDARPVEVSVLGALTNDERARLVVGECGPHWLNRLKWIAEGLRVEVPQPRPGKDEPPFPDLVFLVTTDGKVTRLPSEPELDLAALAAQWQGPASDERDRALVAVARRAATQTGQPERAAIAPLVKRVFATGDAREAELIEAAMLIRSVPAAERVALVELGLARPGAEVAALGALRDDAAFGPMAQKVLDDRKRPAAVRAGALALLTQKPEDAPKLKAALADPDPELRRLAADRISRHGCDVPLSDLLAAIGPTDTVEAVERCLGESKTPDRHAEAAKLVEGGLRPTFEVSFALAVWAEHAAPEKAAKLLDHAEQAGRARKGDGRAHALGVLAHWRVLKALHAGDVKAARAALAKLDPKFPWLLPKLDPADVGKVWRIGEATESVADFSARMKPRLK